MSCFCLAVLKILSLSLAFNSLIVKFLSVNLFGFSYLEFIEGFGFVDLYISSNLRSHYFFKYSIQIFKDSSHPFLTLRMFMLVCLMVSHWSFRLCSVFFILFLLCFSDSVIHLPRLCVHWFFFLLKSTVKLL